MVKKLGVVLPAVAVFLIAAVSAAGAAPSQDADSESVLLEDLESATFVGEDQGSSEVKISMMRYQTCGGALWTCEDCNTRRFCFQFLGFTSFFYLQCPYFAPYCDPNSTFALCTATGSPGCTGATNSTSG